MLTSLTSALLLLSVMLYLGPLFQPLPVSVLAAIILASLFGIVKKVNVKMTIYIWNLVKVFAYVNCKIPWKKAVSFGIKYKVSVNCPEDLKS